MAIKLNRDHPLVNEALRHLPGFPEHSYQFSLHLLARRDSATKPVGVTDFKAKEVCINVFPSAGYNSLCLLLLHLLYLITGSEEIISLMSKHRQIISSYAPILVHELVHVLSDIKKLNEGVQKTIKLYAQEGAGWDREVMSFSVQDRAHVGQLLLKIRTALEVQYADTLIHRSALQSWDKLVELQRQYQLMQIMNAILMHLPNATVDQIHQSAIIGEGKYLSHGIEEMAAQLYEQLVAGTEIDFNSPGLLSYFLSDHMIMPPLAVIAEIERYLKRLYAKQKQVDELFDTVYYWVLKTLTTVSY